MVAASNCTIGWGAVMAYAGEAGEKSRVGFTCRTKVLEMGTRNVKLANPRACAGRLAKASATATPLTCSVSCRVAGPDAKFTRVAVAVASVSGSGWAGKRTRPV